MLVLSRKPNQGFVLDNGRVRIRILTVKGNRVKVGIECSGDVQVLRDELVNGAGVPPMSFPDASASAVTVPG